MAWLGTWAKRIKITIDHNDIDSALTHFPVLIYLSTSSGTGDTDVSCVFDELTSDDNRKKIAVTKSDGTTQLYVEIEKWDDGNEKAWLWVSKSDWSVSDSADTVIYLYYDSSQDANTTYVGDTNDEVAENVWDSNFVGVYHMADGADTSHVYDSTSNDNDGTKKGAAEPAVTTSGKIGNAQHFDGSDDEITLPISESNTLATVECWLKGDGASWPNGNHGLVSMTAWEADVCHFKLQGADHGTNPGELSADSYSGDKLYSGAISTSTWYHAAYTMGGNGANDFILYLQGSSVASGDFNADTMDLIGIQIGDEYTDGRYFDGIIDEVRVSTIARPAAYFKATYETGRDDLLSFGSETLPTYAASVAIGIAPCSLK